jgi:hypothetical protein
LAPIAPDPITAENEYVRIGIEQGLVGMVLWVSFLAWFFTHKRSPLARHWRPGFHLIYALVLLFWADGLVGICILTAIPGTVFRLFHMGLLSGSRCQQAGPRTERQASARERVGRAAEVVA